MTTAHAIESIRPSIRQPATAGQESPRRGIFWDKHAGQWACRIGYKLDEQTGQRVRDTVRRLGGDENQAVVKHAQLMMDWDATCALWPSYRSTIRPGLPDAIRDTADLSKPFWIKAEWIDAAKVNLRADVDAKRNLFAHRATAVVDVAKANLREATTQDQGWIDLLSPDLRQRVLAALAPAAHEVRGVGPDAKPMTIAQARAAFIEYKRSKVGLNLIGRRGGIKGGTLRNIEADLDRVAKLIDDSTDLRSLTHERLEKIIDAAYRKWPGSRTPFNAMRTFKAMLDWCNRTSSIDYRHVETIDDIFRLTKPETKRKDSYDEETIKRLKLLKDACDLTVEKGGEETWLFVLLALNLGAYQCDLAALTFDNLKWDGKQPYLWWQRQKELHHNPNLWTRHDLWPETWQRLQKHLAPKSKAKNPTQRLLLSKRCTPLWRIDAEHAKTCLISLRYRRARANAQDAKGKPINLDLPFQQLRKIALNAVKKFSGGSDDVTRKFAGQKQPGILRHYLADDFADVSAALAKWAVQLRADGVI